MHDAECDIAQRVREHTNAAEMTDDSEGSEVGRENRTHHIFSSGTSTISETSLNVMLSRAPADQIWPMDCERETKQLLSTIDRSKRACVGGKMLCE